MIEFVRVSYRYPGTGLAAIDEIDFTLDGGEMLLVAGPSGGGKSTLLRAANGLVPHFYGGVFSGHVRVDGHDTIDHPPRALAPFVGFVGQDPEAQNVVDNVEDDIAFTLENLQVDESMMRKRIEEVLDALSIAHLRHRDPNTLSGGERQRVAIAGSLVAMPQHLVMDEPTSQLDPQSAEEVIAAILRLRDESGISILVAEQRLERLLQYADGLCAMRDGTLIKGDPSTILREASFGSPMIQLGRALGLDPLPLTLREARKVIKELHPISPAEASTPVAGETLASCRGVSVRIGVKEVLKDIDLDLRQGEVTALIGRNGAGKTTVLRTIAGLIAPWRGTVRLEATFGLVPQNPEAILFSRTIRDELRFTLRGRGLESSNRHVEAEASRLAITDLLDRNPGDLSCGQRTRAALGVVLAGDPDLILLDEPTRGMDQDAREHLVELCAGWASQGKAVLMATHDVELAARVASRVIMMSDGELASIGTPRQILAGSLTFATQMSRIFGDSRVLTLDDALRSLSQRAM